ADTLACREKAALRERRAAFSLPPWGRRWSHASRGDREGLTPARSSPLFLSEGGKRLTQDVVLVGTIVTSLQMLVHRLQGVAERLSDELHLDKFGVVSHAFVTCHLLVTRVHHLRDEDLSLFWTQGHSFVSFATGLGEGRADI